MPASNSCSLDMAASGERSQLDVGKILGVTHAGVALVETAALLKLKKGETNGH
jgi:DNA-directed RNA polymerase specialized sigma subunit